VIRARGQLESNYGNECGDVRMPAIVDSFLLIGAPERVSLDKSGMLDGVLAGSHFEQENSAELGRGEPEKDRSI
jgi:hypothetical protein